MKSTIVTIVAVVCFALSASAQTYTFSRLVKKASVQTTTGTQYRTLSTTPGPFNFVFETPIDPSMKRLFTILNPGQANGPGLPWFALLQESGYVEKNGKLLKKNTYYDTERDERVLVLIADDYSMIVIFKSDETVWEYTR